MLAPDSDLRLVRVEGVSKDDEAEVADRDAFLGVDLTEYYGGTCTNDASSVVFSQLKYSQRHPERPWTASRLCEKSKGRRERSVIARLAQAFAGFSEGRTRTLILKRLQVKLVSNQPADNALIQTLIAAKSWLKSQQAPQTAQLIGALPESCRDIVRLLQKSSGLGSTAFCDFVYCLDLSDCYTDGRLWQRLRLIQEVGRIAPASPTECASDLYERVASEALPRVGDSGLQREDILAALGCHGEDSIFPAHPRFERVANLIPTPDAERILEALLASPSRRLLAHGAGGVGKTSTVLSLPTHRPQGHWIFYDCFGGGTYKDSPGDERHSVRRALLQLSNQLAVESGSPFLIRAPDSKDDIWRAFRNRLDCAAQILKAQGQADRQECVNLILRLWERRQDWPLSAPLKDIADQLNNLLTPKPRFFHDPSKNNTNPFLDLLHELDALHRRETQVCLAAWAAGLDLDKSREYLQNHAEHLDDAELEITRRLTQIQNLMLSPKAHLDGEACPDFHALSGVERGKLIREKLRSIAKSRTKVLGRS